MIMREPEIWRWSHTRHHTDTIIVGRDPEIITPRPPDVVSLLLNIFALKGALGLLSASCFCTRAAASTEEEATFVPESERPKVYRNARIYLAIYAAVIVACVCVPLDPAGHVYRSAVLLRRVARALFRRDPAPRPRRGRARPPAEFAHRLHEPDLPVPLLEHELSRRAPHLSDRALSRAARAACGDQGGLPDALSELHRRLSRDHPDGHPAASKEPTYFVKRELPAGATPLPDRGRASRPRLRRKREREDQG